MYTIDNRLLFLDKDTRNKLEEVSDIIEFIWDDLDCNNYSKIKIHDNWVSIEKLYKLSSFIFALSNKEYEIDGIDIEETKIKRRQNNDRIKRR